MRMCYSPCIYLLFQNSPFWLHIMNHNDWCLQMTSEMIRKCYQELISKVWNYVREMKIHIHVCICVSFFKIYSWDLIPTNWICICMRPWWEIGQRGGLQEATVYGWESFAMDFINAATTLGICMIVLSLPFNFSPSNSLICILEAYILCVFKSWIRC